MRTTPTLHTVGRSRTGSVYGTGPISQHRVDGLLPGEEAWIANFGSSHHETWRILRTKDGVKGDWTGTYKSAENALAVLRKEFQK